MTSAARRRERVLREALLDAARHYADATTRGEGDPGEGLLVAARVRLAAKEWRRAEREAMQVRP